MKMNYHRGDKITNRYLSSDAFTSLKNKLGGRSITSLGSSGRRRNSYRIANQGFDLLEYKTLIYRIFISLLILMIFLYIIPQTRYFIHGFSADKFDNINIENISNNDETYNVAPVLLNTDYLVSKQKDIYKENNNLVYDALTNNIIGYTDNVSSSTLYVKLFSDPGFKNDLLIEQNNIISSPEDINTTNSTTSSTTTEINTKIIKEENTTYKSYLFEGMGYGQLIAKVPPRTEIKKDSYVYIRTIEGLKPIAKIISVNEDNQSTFTVIYAQLIVAPQNIYKVLIK